MRAIVLEKFGGPDSLVYKEIPEPEPKFGQAVIQIKAFGLNHAEMHMRRGERAEAAPVLANHSGDTPLQLEPLDIDIVQGRP
jgi:NADPH:quinone reductase